MTDTKLLRKNMQKTNRETSQILRLDWFNL